MAESQTAENEGEIEREMKNANGLFRNACVVRLTMDDPVNENLDEGSVLIQEGRCEDEISHTVRCDEKKGFVDIECEVLERFEADTWMSRDNIKDWAVQQAKKTGDW